MTAAISATMISALSAAMSLFCQKRHFRRSLGGVSGVAVVLVTTLSQVIILMGGHQSG